MSQPRWTSIVDVALMEGLCVVLAATGIQERFFAKVDRRTIDHEDECWIWLGALSSEGYGNFSVRVDGRERTVRAHRVAWFMQTLRPLERYHYLDHLIPVCRGRYCVNPLHLEPVDKAENDRRATGTTSASTQRVRRYEHLLERDHRQLTTEGAA